MRSRRETTVVAVVMVAAAICAPRADGQVASVDTTSTSSLLVRVTRGREPIVSALVRADATSGVTGNDGNIIFRLSPGTHTIVVSRLGFVPDSVRVLMLPATDTSISIELIPATTALAPVIVGASRAERRVQDEPERVEVLSGEDVAEKTVMHPANPATLLSEMPGIRVQTTSPGLGGAGVRLQGLRGRYTLLLVDGLPLYGFASEGLGFLQIPPLDIAQAEVIKGAATALYGPAAGGGVLNLISRRPPKSERPDKEILLNQTSWKGTDALVWIADSLSSAAGYTLITGAHNQSAVDVNKDGWADIPAFTRFEARPRIFWQKKNGSSAMITLGAADEHRHSGFVNGSRLGATRAYRVVANTRRGDVGGTAHLVSRRGDVISIRASANQQWQDRRFGDSTENDRRGTAFAEATARRSFGKHETLLGAALQDDALSSAVLRNARYNFFTGSLFGQETFTPAEQLSVSATARLDHHNRYGTFLSPRLSALIRVAPTWSARVSAGRGVFAPTPLVEDADAVGLARVRGFSSLNAETLTQASADITHAIGDLEITGTVFRSTISDAVVVRESAANGTIILLNAPKPTRTSGSSFYAVYNRDPVTITALYGYTRSSEWSPDKSRLVEVALTPRHSAGLDFAVDADETGTRAGIEIFYTGRQTLEDNPYRAISLPYTTVGILVAQKIGHASVFANGENLTGVRQTRFDPLLLPRQAATGKWTTSEWAPLEGRMLNAGLRITY